MHILIAESSTLVRAALSLYIRAVMPSAHILLADVPHAIPPQTKIDIAIVPSTWAALPALAGAKIIDPSEGVHGRSLWPQSWDDDPLIFNDKEKDIAGYVLRGSSNKEIARALNMTDTSVKHHVRSLCRKLGAENRTQAALILQKRMLN